MNNIQICLALVLMGILTHMLMRRSYDFGQYLRSMMFGQRGEGAAAAATAPTEIPADLQPLVDKVVQERIARERGKFADYEDLKKFKTEHEKLQDANKQKELEAQKNYEEAKKGYDGKITELSNKLTASEQAIRDRDIRHGLTLEISKQNGFIEESIALLRSMADVDANGNVLIKGKDKNGVDVNLSIEEGVKQFLTQRPHLVKVAAKSGGGSGAGDGSGAGSGAAGGGQGEDLSSLNAQLMDAMRARDLKKASEVRGKIKAKLAEKKVSI